MKKTHCIRGHPRTPENLRTGTHSGQCKLCHRERERARYRPVTPREKHVRVKAINTARDKERTKAWVLAHPERSREIKAEYKLRHREKVKAAARDYAKRKRATLTEAQREEQRRYNRARHHRRYPQDVNLRIKVNLRARLYKAIKGVAKWESGVALLGCSIDSFKLYLESRFESGMTWDNYGKGPQCWNIDHILPCAIFDLRRADHQSRCFHFSNMQPLWEPANLRKNASVPEGVQI